MLIKFKDKPHIFENAQALIKALFRTKELCTVLQLLLDISISGTRFDFWFNISGFISCHYLSRMHMKEEIRKAFNVLFYKVMGILQPLTKIPYRESRVDYLHFFRAYYTLLICQCYSVYANPSYSSFRCSPSEQPINQLISTFFSAILFEEMCS